MFCTATSLFLKPTKENINVSFLLALIVKLPSILETTTFKLFPFSLMLQKGKPDPSSPKTLPLISI